MKYYGPTLQGPEQRLEKVLVSRLSELFSIQPGKTWLAGSLAVGSGLPDILIAHWREEVLALKAPGKLAVPLLAYLRSVSRARPATMAQRVGAKLKDVQKELTSLLEAGAVAAQGDCFRLAPVWRSVLTEITTIEVKVSNLRVATAQAARNSILAHRSFIAMPYRTALRAAKDPSVIARGLGVIGIEEDRAVVIRKARRGAPRVWTYYYQIAKTIAKEVAPCHSTSRLKRRRRSSPSSILSLA